MTAKEMFEKIHYEQVCNDNTLIKYKLYDNEILFWLDFGGELEIKKDKNYYSMELLQAIYQQCKELGWIE